jgi:hypothetical protein
MRHTVHCLVCLRPLRCTMALRCATHIACAAAVGDQGERKATHQAGIPFHQEPRDTDNVQRIPDGTPRHHGGLSNQWAGGQTTGTIP